MYKRQVKGRAPKTGYSRDEFGPRWADADHNGCDTRNDVLRRDLTGIDVKPGTHGCTVAAGSLLSPYTGVATAFTAGQDTSSEAVSYTHLDVYKRQHPMDRPRRGRQHARRRRDADA